MNFDRDYIGTKFVLIVFKVLGLAPFAVQRLPVSKLSKNKNRPNFARIQCSPSRLGCLYNLLLIAVKFCILLWAIPNAYTVKFPDNTTVTVTIVVGTAAFGNSALFLIYLIVGFRQKAAVNVLNRLLSMDSTIFGCRPCESSRIFFIGIFLTNIFIWTGVIMTREMAYNFPVISIFRIFWPSIIITWLISQYILIVKVIHNRLRAVNRGLLDQLPGSSTNNAHRLFVAREVTLNDSHVGKIMTLRRVHADLYEIATEVSDFYSLPILLAIAHLCVVFIFTCYTFILPLLMTSQPGADMIMITAALSAISSVLPIVILSMGINSFTTEMTKTADIVNQLMICSNINEAVGYELKQFAFDLMHREVNFTAWGLFSLDCSLLQSILSMSTTYLIILIQHQMGHGPRADQNHIHNCTNVQSNSAES